MSAVLSVTAPRKKAHLSRDAVWLSNGRLVSRTIDEPEIKRAIDEQRADLRKDPQALKDYYIKRGFLTPAGKLSKRYGG